MRILRFLFTMVVCELLAAGLLAQSTAHTMTDGTVVPFPDLTITSTAVGWSVTYDPIRGVYRYAYTLSAPATNLAPVHAFKIDISGKTPRTQIDPSLQENIVRHPQLQAPTTIPVGLTVPDPTQWTADVSAGGTAFFHARKENFDLLAGNTEGGFVIESKLGPGIRSTEISPSDQAWFRIGDKLPDNGAEFIDPPDVRTFTAKTTTVGPADLTDADLFDGGGQRPADVNKFLRYASPLQSRTKVPANSSYIVIVYYGKTIDPSTFSAALDRGDVTSSFHPIPGGADAITIKIGMSTIKLELSVAGTKSSGGTGTDSDTLTFIPQ